MKYRMLNIQVGERVIKRLYLEKLEEKLKEVGAEFFILGYKGILKKNVHVVDYYLKRILFLISVYKNLKWTENGIFRLKERRHFY